MYIQVLVYVAEFTGTVTQFGHFGAKGVYSTDRGLVMESQV